MNNPIEKAMEITNLSAERLADLLGVTKTTINNYRKNPGAMGLDELVKLSQETGIALDCLIEKNEPIPGPVLKSVFSKNNNQLEKVLKRAEERKSDIERLQFEDNYMLANEEKAIAIERFENIIINSKLFGKKTLVAAFGPSDSGKSTLINYFLGDSVIPASYTPLTTVPTYIMHISEKPNIFEDDADNAIVFGRPLNSKKTCFNHDYLTLDSAKAEKYIIRKGNAESILKDFGTREGAYYDNETWNIEEIDIYLDSDILKEITLVDLPGFGTGDRKEDDVSLTMDMRKFDISFFLSPADGFQRASELSACLNVLRSIPCNTTDNNKECELNRVYFLATHCNSIGNPDKVKDILHRGCERLVKMMSETEKERLGITDESFKAIEKRFFGFDNTMKYYCETLNKDIVNNVYKISKKKYQDTLFSLRNICVKYEETYRKELEKIQKGKGRTKGQKRESKRSKAFLESVQDALDESKKKLKKSISEHSEQNKEEFKEGYLKIMDSEYIKTIIDKKSLKNKKTDIETLTNYLSSELEDALNKSMGSHSSDFSEEVNIEIDNYQKTIKSEVDSQNYELDITGFDFTRAFASGLTGLVAYGALALWATIAAGGSNLGAYILVAKVVSVLSSLGISLGGTAAVISAVSAIGGPVTIGVALSLLAAVAAFGVFTGTWKSRVANRIVKEYEKENVLEKYLDYIDEYWEDTEIALDACFNQLHEQTLQYVEAAIKAHELDEEEKITSGILIENMFKNLISFFDELCSLANIEINS